MSEQDINQDSSLSDSDLDNVAGGANVVVHEARRQEQGDKLTAAEQAEKSSLSSQEDAAK